MRTKPGRCGVLPDFIEVNKSALHIGASQLDTKPLADVHARKTARQPSLDRWMKNANPRSFVRSSSDDGIKMLSAFRLQQQGGGGFSKLSFDFLRGVVRIGGMLGECR